MKIIFLGAPGAGKGTQAEIVSRRLGIPSISTGAIIREAIKSGTPMGIQAKEYSSKGQLVPDDVVIGIIKERLSAPDCKNGFGEMGVELDAVVSIEVPDEVIIERMTGRRVCDKCGATYHLTSIPPKDGKNCDKCGTPLSVRADDQPDVVKQRLRVYHETTEPLKDFYASTGKLKLVEGQDKVEDTTALTLAALGV